ncbi:GyrI-like domain-containing protein [Microlunatus speluncae]|uniref:GyrI-like domain-containing protein n=1 Tax=Microlunatus speluncae TaxID=2594267 RepID=UPI0012663B2B|nr:GyrI-like domain-containing protein [Microlunatus speluncae]
MINEPRVEDRSEQPYVSIRTRANFTEWGGVNALIGEVQDWLAARELAPAGPPLYRYHLIGNLTDRFDVEVGFPVAAPVAGDERVITGALPAGRYLVLEHRGHPDSIGGSHAALVDWAEAHGVALTGSPDRLRWGLMFESYVTDPAEVPEPGQWVTELVYQVA